MQDLHGQPGGLCHVGVWTHVHLYWLWQTYERMPNLQVKYDCHHFSGLKTIILGLTDVDFSFQAICSPSGKNLQSLKLP